MTERDRNDPGRAAGSGEGDRASPGSGEAEQSAPVPEGSGRSSAGGADKGQGTAAGAGTKRTGEPPQVPSGDEENVPSGLRWFLGGSSKQAGMAADIAYGVVGGILGIGCVGWLIDRWLGSAPTGMLIGMLLGGVVGFYRLGRAMLGKR